MKREKVKENFDKFPSFLFNKPKAVGLSLQLVKKKNDKIYSSAVRMISFSEEKRKTYFRGYVWILRRSGVWFVLKQALFKIGSGSGLVLVLVLGHQKLLPEPETGASRVWPKRKIG